MPTLPFFPRKGNARNGLVHDREHIDRIFHSLNTTDAALQLARRTPDWIRIGRTTGRRAANSNRRNIVITLCADRRGTNPMHRISIVGVNAADRVILDDLGLSVRPAKSRWQRPKLALRNSAQ